MLRNVCLGLVCAAALGTPAWAHFIWLDLRPSVGGKGQARLYFSEEPAPGEADLIGKAAKAQVWLRKADGTTAELKLDSSTEDEAVLVAECACDGASLEGVWDYGVYSRGPVAGPLLQYYAKGLTGDWVKHPSLSHSKKLKLDIVPSLQDRKLSIQVLYDGESIKDCDVLFVDPTGQQHELTTDDQGRAEVEVTPGQWAVRTAKIDADNSGERDGKKFSQTWHFATLTVDVPSRTPAEEQAVESVSAINALVRARKHRAVWQDFPGFKADLTVLSDEKVIKGTMEIDRDGVVTLDMPKSNIADWVEEQLNSMVQHRMPDGEVSEGNVTWAQEEGVHPLGRKIDLGDPRLQSTTASKTTSSWK